MKAARSSLRTNLPVDRAHLKQLYRDMAPRYLESSAPTLHTLAACLYARLTLRPDDRVIDIGTGAGAAARLAAEEARRVWGVDFSMAMLACARRAPGAAYLCADAHALPFPDAAFTLAVSVFCFNETRPAAAFAEARRVLRPGGRIALLEWGPVDPLMAQIDDVLAMYAVAEASGPFHAAMRALAARVRSWDRVVSSGGDIVRLLRDAGFQEARCRPITGAVPFDSVDAFLGYALAWSPRRAELEAMPAPVRARCLHHLRASVKETAPVWRPALLYAEGIR